MTNRGGVLEVDAEKLRQWLSSPEARKEIEEASKRVEQIEKEWAESRKINPDDLHKPVTSF